MCLSGRETKTHSEFTRRKNLDIYRVFRELCQEIQPNFPCIISHMRSKNTDFVCIGNVIGKNLKCEKIGRKIAPSF